MRTVHQYRVRVTFATGGHKSYSVLATHKDEATSLVDRYLAGRREWVTMRGY